MLISARVCSLRREGKHAEASVLLRQALSEMRKLLVPGHVDAMNAVNELVNVFIMKTVSACARGRGCAGTREPLTRNLCPVPSGVEGGAGARESERAAV